MSENKSLYDLNKSLSEITFKIEQNDGLLTEEVELALSQLMSKVVDKVDGYGAILDRIDATASYWKSQSDKCKTVEKSLNNLSDSLKKNLKSFMLSNQKKEISAAHYRFVLSSTAERLVIEDENQIPQEFKNQVVSWEVNKEKITECLKIGQHVPGARLEGGFALKKYINRSL